MGWLRLVSSIKLQVSFAKEPYKRDDILQKRRIILRSLLIVATPYTFREPTTRIVATPIPRQGAFFYRALLSEGFFAKEPSLRMVLSQKRFTHLGSQRIVATLFSIDKLYTDRVASLVQHTVCNTLTHTATRWGGKPCSSGVSAHCNTIQCTAKNTAPHWKTLHHTAKYCTTQLYMEWAVSLVARVLQLISDRL